MWEPATTLSLLNLSCKELPEIFIGFGYSKENRLLHPGDGSLKITFRIRPSAGLLWPGACVTYVFEQSFDLNVQFRWFIIEGMT